MKEPDYSVGEVTELLRLIESGQGEAEPRLIELMYHELRRIAAARMKHERTEHTLTPTALVHEAYMRLGGAVGRQYADRAHFLAVIAQAMRRVLVDHARKRNALRRDGHAAPAQAEWMMSVPEPDDRIIAIDEALTQLAAINPRQSRVVELRYFAGLTEDQVASVLGVTRRTVNRDWKMARAWLFGALGEKQE